MKLSTLQILIFAAISISTQSKEWKTEIADDGKTEVMYVIYDSLNTDRDEVKFIEYRAQIRTTATLEKCVEVFNNPDMHKIFYEYTEISKKIKDVSENEWIIYYYYSPPWPIADSDCVSRITMNGDTLNSRIVFTSFSEPSLLETKDVTRSEMNDITFSFTRLNDNEVEIFIEAILIPVTPAPAWMMSSWFPEGPAGILSRFKVLAEKNNPN